MGSVCGGGRPLAAGYGEREAGCGVRGGASDGMKGLKGREKKGYGRLAKKKKKQERR